LIQGHAVSDELRDDVHVAGDMKKLDEGRVAGVDLQAMFEELRYHGTPLASDGKLPGDAPRSPSFVLHARVEGDFEKIASFLAWLRLSLLIPKVEVAHVDINQIRK
jgi:hypothetical protein